MHGKTVIYIFIAVIIAISAYYFILQKNSSTLIVTIPNEQIELLESSTKLKVVIGTLVEVNSENLMLSTNDGILTIKKSGVTRYIARSNEVTTPIGGNELISNKQATVVTGVDETTGEIIALSVTVNREQSALTSRPQFLIFDSFESTLINSTAIHATSNSTFSGRDYNNIPAGWVIRFFTPSEFKWDDNVYRSGKSSIRMNNPGDISASKRVNLDTISNRNLTLTSWVRSNVLTRGFAFIQIDYTNQENKRVILRRSLKITGSNDWRSVRLQFEVPADVINIFIRLNLPSIRENPELYERLSTLVNNPSEVDEKLPTQAVWFDDIRLSEG